MTTNPTQPVELTSRVQQRAEPEERRLMTAAPGTRSELPVALVCMPFQSAQRPSIQVGLLASVARQAGFPVETFHLNLELAATLGTRVAEEVAGNRAHNLGEWLFSVAAFDSTPDPEGKYLDEYPGGLQVAPSDRDDPREYLLRLRDEVLPEFIDRWAEAVDWGAFGVVGFTSMFQQNAASLALARRIKERHPATTTVFGGANFEQEMGEAFFAAFPCVDIGVTGEADLTFPILLDRLAKGEDPEGIPGMTTRRDGRILRTPAAEPLADLDQLPTPDYDEYFRRWDELELASESESTRMLPFETSRGCWWGQKHHCTFCGLNGEDMRFRSKSAERVLAELDELAGSHRWTAFDAVDNILDNAYVRTLFPKLEEAEVDYTFFYEVKASLTRKQIAQMWRGGVRAMQPGTESLSTHVLGLMRKGTTMLKNVRVLKWAHYYGINTAWNILFGFPGERREDYEQQLDLLHRLTHLQPPDFVGTIGLVRFSPYFFDSDSFPIDAIEPERSYHHIYPTHVDMEKAAYFFDCMMGDSPGVEMFPEIRSFCDGWQERYEQGHTDSLHVRRIPDGILIADRRRYTPAGEWSFEADLAMIYQHCMDTMRDAASVRQHLEEHWRGSTPTEARVSWALEEFCERGLMVGEGGDYLSLALPVEPPR